MRINMVQQATAKPVGVRDKMGDFLRRYVSGIGGLLEVTYNYRGGYNAGVNTGVPSIPGGFNVSSVKLDFAAIAADRIAKGQAAIGAADVLEVFSIQAGILVLAVGAQCTKVEGAALTIGVGDGAGASDFIAAFSLNALAATWNGVTSASSIAVGGGKLYTAADTVDVLVNTASADVAVVHITVAMIDLRVQRS